MNLFDPLVQVFRLVFEGFYNLTAAVGFANYGIAIILMTILVKALMYPLTAKQVRSMKAMQELQPALKKLQKDYKNNPQLLQQKMAELYKEAGVNPLAGCLPLLIQMPILMGVYYCLYGYSYSGDPTFLWLTSLSDTDPLYVLPILSALTTYIQQKQTMANNGQDNQQMKIMSYMMPLFIGWISLNFPSGLVVYWVTMNLCQIAQQWYMFRGEKKLAVEVEDASASDKKKR
ncbi:MAG: membrane protein insertase YidC [Selenomonadaceae bacterium]|uniref:Membrane protein insertase YidC n=3 Tax=Anaerovibrio TaxID=82373 RepID=A0A6I2UCT8_9FIRM|nr:membrane protein insertase YidC [Selenomonadaceae bacterium]MSU09358.1 membrane protein insertase YidC [Anaerovibrio slackiae]MBQ5650597.1 membrane protein insertase YidC [Selenomonadaceae bacterium]MBQ5731858.1 membrane protein insertase YidC [Selenomonadaceae bacterium]MBQ5845220.1 membrane protein insertase YidC [Selenomonadaceae bacterium]